MQQGDPTKGVVLKEFVYTGQVQNGKPHGSGESVSRDGREKLVGEWKNGLREGNSVWYKDGIKRSEGEYRNGKMHGKCCKIYYKDGSIHFEGEFEDGLRHGEGT